jgi:hypothetical protein
MKLRGSETRNLPHSVRIVIYLSYGLSSLAAKCTHGVRSQGETITMSVKSVLLASTIVAGSFALGMSARASTLLLAAGGGGGAADANSNGGDALITNAGGNGGGPDGGAGGVGGLGGGAGGGTPAPGGGMTETFAQLDELLVTLSASAGQS